MSVDGIKLDTKVLDRIAANLGRSADKIIGGICVEVMQSAQSSMVGGSGRIYKRGKRIHQASAPGEPPAPDYGALKNSIKIRREKVGQWIVHDGVSYGIHLEFGAPRNKMAARPFMTPAVEKVRKSITKRFKGLIK